MADETDEQKTDRIAREKLAAAQVFIQNLARAGVPPGVKKLEITFYYADGGQAMCELNAVPLDQNRNN